MPPLERILTLKELVTLATRPSRDGKTFTYVLAYQDEHGKRVRQSLGHADKRKAQRQRDQKERELRMGIVQPGSLKLSDFLKDSISRTRGQIRDSSLDEYESCFNDFLRFTGNIELHNVTLKHAEMYIQKCLDCGNRPATAAKKVRHLKRLLQLGVERGQLEQNPFRFLKTPKSPQKAVRFLSEDECRRLIDAASRFSVRGAAPNWLLLLELTLCTGMRKGEALNLTWKDVDFVAKTVEVSPKSDTADTWKWYIKDSERRLLPITEDVVNLLTQHFDKQTEGNPYLFVPESRYRFIQSLRSQGRWNVNKGKNPLNNFDRQMKAILDKAGIDNCTFHDLRRTCLTHWFKGGLREFDVMRMAGHSSFETTRKFYMGVDRTLLEKTRQANAAILEPIFGTRLTRAPQIT